MEIIFLFILGLFVGSFLNVLVDRLPRGESVFGGRSHCESCKKELAWYDLVPLLSFITLKGKCRYCHTPLSIYYPIVELTTGILFVFTIILIPHESIKYKVLSIEQIIALVYYLIIISSLIVVFYTDLKYGIIPDKVVFLTILLSVFYFILHTLYFILPHLLSAIGAFIFFLFLFLVTRGRGMGFGDVKFSFLMGLILGFPGIIIALYTAFLTGAIVGCILIVWKKKRLTGTKIPFGPFLVLGTLSALFLEKQILEIVFPFLFPL